MATKLQAPRGTFDVLPADGRRRAALARTADELLGRAGYEPFETPVFEDTEVFARGVGEATDIVRKEMFSFEDKAGRSLTLRPEGTAGVCRAYVEHGMHKLPQPVKLRYWGPFFRHEAPQAGRYRQFTQLGAEALGSDDPSLDAEIVLLLVELVEAVGARDIRVRLSSLGTPETREEYLAELGAYLREHESELSDDVRDRLATNPLRAFDADHPGTRAVMAGAPRLPGPARGRGRRALRRRARPAGRRRAVVRGGHRARARARLLHPHGVRGRVGGARSAERSGRRRALRPAGGAARRPAHTGRGLRGRGGANPAGRGGGRRVRRRRRVRGRGRPRRGALGLRARAAVARARPEACSWSRPGAPSRAS